MCTACRSHNHILMIQGLPSCDRSRSAWERHCRCNQVGGYLIWLICIGGCRYKSDGWATGCSQTDYSGSHAHSHRLHALSNDRHASRPCLQHLHHLCHACVACGHMPAQHQRQYLVHCCTTQMTWELTRQGPSSLSCMGDECTQSSLQKAAVGVDIPQLLTKDLLAGEWDDGKQMTYDHWSWLQSRCLS